MKTLRIILLLMLLVGFVNCKTQNATVQSHTETVAIDQPKSVNIRGEKLHYVEQGKGEPLIFIHGSLGDYRAWISRMEPYSKDYHVLTYSRRYAWPNKQVFDESADYSIRIHADDLYELIQKLRLKKVHLVGPCSYKARKDKSTGSSYALVCRRPFPTMAGRYIKGVGSIAYQQSIGDP